MSDSHNFWIVVQQKVRNEKKISFRKLYQGEVFALRMAQLPVAPGGSPVTEEFIKFAETRYGKTGYFVHDTGAIGRALALYGEWAEHEIAFLRHFIPTGGTVVDIGAFIGTHSLAFANAVGASGLVVAFEAQPVTFQLLAENIRINRLAQVRATNAVVADCIGGAEVPCIDIECAGGFGSASLRDLGSSEPLQDIPGAGQEVHSTARVPLVTIDGLQLGRCDLIKLDIEGMEHLALRGCEQTIKRLRPIIYAECNSVEDGVRSLEVLKSLGYDVHIHVVTAFNPRNFRGTSENIFGPAREAALVGIPSGSGERLSAIKLQDDEILATVETADDIVFALLNKPQYPGEILARSKAASSSARQWLDCYAELEAARADLAALRTTVQSGEIEAVDLRADLAEMRRSNEALMSAMVEAQAAREAEVASYSDLARDAERRAAAHEAQAAALTQQVHDVTAERDALREQVRLSHQSLSWRVTRPLRQAYSWVSKSVPAVPRLRLYLGALRAASRTVPGGRWLHSTTMRLDAVPGKHLSVQPDGMMVCQQDDVQVSLRVEHGRQISGWCLFTFTVVEASGPLHPVLCYDDDETNEACPVVFPMPSLTAGRSDNLIRVHGETTRLRLVMRARRGVRFRLSAAGVTGLSRFGLLFGAVMKLTPDQRVPFVRSIARGNFDRARHIVRQSLAPREQAYSHWVELYDRLTDHDKAAIRKRIEVLPEKPLLSVLMPVYNPPVRYMRLAIDSVIAQLYPHWELCIADDKSSSPEVRKVLAHYASTDPRIKVTYRSENGHISACSNSALELVTGSFVVLMDQDDELPAHALYMIAEELNAHPDADVIYSDEDKIDADGQRFNPYFKPDWNSELFYSQNFVAHMGVYRTALVRQIGGFRIGYEGSQDYDLVLRILPLTRPDRIRHIPHVLYHWRRFPEAETFSSANPGRSIQSARQALEDYFAARQEAVDIVAITAFHWWRVKRAVPRPLPRVCVIIPTRDALGLLRNCLDGLLSRTDYDNLEIIIIDNESQDPETLAFLEQITTTQAAVRVLRVTGRFDFSMLNNRAAALTDADFLLFLNNDIEVMQPAWLTEMVSHGVQSDVGAVGAKLYYRHGTVQHAGVVLGIYGVASHGLRHRSHHDVGYFGRLSLAQDVSAATAACLLVRKRVFDEIGGYCERELAVGYGDVDLCLRIRHAGYRVVQSQFAELYHLESATRGDDLTREQRVRNLRERAFMRARWGSLLDNDPFYSPNLSLKTEDYDLAFPPRAVRPWRDVDAATAQYLRHEGLEFVCPFHRGDVLLGVQAAAAAVASGVSVRFHVAEPLLEWVEDFQPPFAVLPIPMQVPDAEGVQPGLHVARRYVERRADAAPFVVISHPSRSLKDTGGNLVPHMLDVLSAPVEPMANLMPVVPPARAQDVRRQLGTFGERVVLIHPAGGWALKSLPPDMTRRLIDLVHELGFQAVQIGGAGDAAIPEMDGHLLRNWSPASWRAAFAAAVAVAGVDSWSSHFAAILDVPQIVFYGPTNPVHVSSKRWFQHRDAPMLALGPVVGCSPCDSLTCTVYGDAVCRGFTLDPAAVRRFFSHLGTEPNRTVEAEALEADPHVLPQPRLLRC